ncbi:MAG: hypothetical protein M5U01_42915 [Ardenticatenaceae bacterium]|nr:hypothetical protein [Ardenticatenaceae bacterium]
MITYASRWEEVERLLAEASHLRLNEAQLSAVARGLRERKSE